MRPTREGKDKSAAVFDYQSSDSETDVQTKGQTAMELLKPVVLDVECGPNKARFHLDKLQMGSKGPCVFFEDAWLTPNEFQFVSGRETAKDWKRSIKHFTKSLKLLMAKGYLTLSPPECRCEHCGENAPPRAERKEDSERENVPPAVDGSSPRQAAPSLPTQTGTGGVSTQQEASLPHSKHRTSEKKTRDKPKSKKRPREVSPSSKIKRLVKKKIQETKIMKPALAAMPDGVSRLNEVSSGLAYDHGNATSGGNVLRQENIISSDGWQKVDAEKSDDSHLSAYDEDTDVDVEHATEDTDADDSETRNTDSLNEDTTDSERNREPSVYKDIQNQTSVQNAAERRTKSPSAVLETPPSGTAGEHLNESEADIPHLTRIDEPLGGTHVAPCVVDHPSTAADDIRPPDIISEVATDKQTDIAETNLPTENPGNTGAPNNSIDTAKDENLNMKAMCSTPEAASQRLEQSARDANMSPSVMDSNAEDFVLSPNKEARLTNIIEELRTYKKHLEKKIETTEGEPDKERDSDDEERIHAVSIKQTADKAPEVSGLSPPTLSVPARLSSQTELPGPSKPTKRATEEITTARKHATKPPKGEPYPHTADRDLSDTPENSAARGPSHNSVMTSDIGNTDHHRQRYELGTISKQNVTQETSSKAREASGTMSKQIDASASVPRPKAAQEGPFSKPKETQGTFSKPREVHTPIVKPKETQGAFSKPMDGYETFAKTREGHVSLPTTKIEYGSLSDISCKTVGSTGVTSLASTGCPASVTSCLSSSFGGGLGLPYLGYPYLPPGLVPPSGLSAGPSPGVPPAALASPMLYSSLYGMYPSMAASMGAGGLGAGGLLPPSGLALTPKLGHLDPASRGYSLPSYDDKKKGNSPSEKENGLSKHRDGPDCLMTCSKDASKPKIYPHYSDTLSRPSSAISAAGDTARRKPSHGNEGAGALDLTLSLKRSAEGYPIAPVAKKICGTRPDMELSVNKTEVRKVDDVQKLSTSRQDHSKRRSDTCDKTSKHGRTSGHSSHVVSSSNHLLTNSGQAMSSAGQYISSSLAGSLSSFSLPGLSYGLPSMADYSPAALYHSSLNAAMASAHAAAAAAKGYPTGSPYAAALAAGMGPGGLGPLSSHYMYPYSLH